MGYTYFLIFALIMLNLVLWLFMEKIRKESQKTIASIDNKCNSLGDRLKKIEKKIEDLQTGINEISGKLGDHPVAEHFGKLRGELLNGSDSIPAKIKDFVESLIEKSPKVEMSTSTGIGDQVLQRLDTLEDKLEALKSAPPPVEEIRESVSPFADEPMGSGMIFDLAEEEQQPVEPLPHQVLIDVLKRYDSLPGVKDMLQELEAIELEKITHYVRRNLLDIYQRYYRSESNDLATALERILESDYGMTFKKARKGLHESSAVGFERVKWGQKYLLADFEKRKIANESFEQGSRDIILFELCPQVSYNKELILKGKVIIS
jgi:tetrahydromethanopterin S-methyltransferase subunit G